MTDVSRSTPSMSSRRPRRTPETRTDEPPMRSPRFALRCWIIGSICFVSALQAQQVAPRYDPSSYEHRSADISMRDGVKLHVEIFSPRDATEPLPFLVERTPYGVAE